jgi:hypothetical protein
MIHQLITVNEYRMIIDYSVEENLKSFKEEVLEELYSIYKNEGISDLMFSGGMDSTFILRSLMELGIKPNLHTICFTKDASDYDGLVAKSRCKQYGLKEPNFFYMDGYEIVKHIEMLTFEKKIAFPMLHGYYVDYFLSKVKDKKFYSGMLCEYKLSNKIITMPAGPIMVKLNNKNRLYGFSTSRTFLSYINHKKFIENYKRKNNTLNFESENQDNVWEIRNLIYTDCFPDIMIVEKDFPGDRKIANLFHTVLIPQIKEELPVNFLVEPFKFDVGEYFNNKLLRKKQNESS